jgi:hypothetical protein
MILDKLDRILESSNSYAGEEVQDVTVEELFESAILEPAKDWYRLQSALFMTDVQLEESALNTRMDAYLGESITESATEIEILAEAAATGFKEKAKDLFTKIKNKVVNWVRKAVAYIKLFFSSGEKFIRKYETEIKNAANLQPTIKAKMPVANIMSFSRGKSNIESIYKKAANVIDSSFIGNATTKGSEDVISDICGKKTLSEVKEEVKKSISASNAGTETNVAILDSLSFIKNFGKTYLQNIKKEESTITKGCDVAIKELKKNKDDSDLNKKVAACKTALNCCTTALGVEYDIVKKASSQHESILKKALRQHIRGPKKKDNKSTSTSETKATGESYTGMSMDLDIVTDFSEF